MAIAASKMYLLKRKKLLKKLNSSRTPRIIVSKQDEIDTQDTEKPQIVEPHKAKLPKISPENLLKIPDEHNMNYDEGDEVIAVKIPKSYDDDDLLNDILMLKTRTRELAYDFEQLSARTAAMWKELKDIRVLKK